MDREEFLDAYYQTRSKAGTFAGDIWEAQKTENGLYSVVGFDDSGSYSGDIAYDLDEGAARWIALAHNAAGQIVEGFREALDDAERIEVERDEAVAQNLRLEVLLQEVQQR